jgi:hypothetical protein
MRRGRAVALVVVGLFLVAIAVGRPSDGRGGPLDPDGTSPAGARGLVLLLEALGAEVELVEGPPPAEATTAVMPLDVLFGDDAAATLDWVAGGGVLLVGVDTSPVADGGSSEACPAVLAGVEVLAVDVDDELARDEGTGCFDGFVRSETVGDGTVVALASPAPLTNELLDEADDAVLAAEVLVPVPGTRVAFVVGPSTVATGEDRTLGDLVAERVRQAFVLAAVAGLVWVAWRARRLGRPVVEEQPVAIAGSELVVAVGRLLESRRRPDEAAALLRADVRRAVTARMGLPADADTRAVAAAVASRSTVDADRAAAALGDRPVVTEADLVAVTDDLDRIRTDILGSRS